MDLRHKGEKIMEKYSVVDLFAGAGGLSLGFMRGAIFAKDKFVRI